MNTADPLAEWPAGEAVLTHGGQSGSRLWIDPERGFAFAFVLSLNEYIIAFMTVGFTVETLPIKIFNALRYGYTPVMASVAVVFVLLAAIIFGLIGRFGDLPKLLGAMNPEQK